MLKSVIFDMDGTILDTLDDLYHATNYVLSLNHFPTRTREEVRSCVGNGIYRLVELSAPPICQKPLIDLMFDDFCAYYKDHCAIETKPYEGIIELIQQLKQKGIKVAVVSNKADFAVQELCMQYFPDLFDYAVGSKENVRKKPYPDTVNEALAYFHHSTNDSIYIGDSEVDIETAKNANMDVLVCNWGFRDEDFLLAHGAKTIINTPDEILSYIGAGSVTWDANQYEKFLKERTLPSIDLISRIDIEPETILDLGCGTGNSTILLKQRFPSAKLQGGDSSEEMLEKARINYPDLEFIHFNGQTDFVDKHYDLIYSNACIQWIPDHHQLITNMYNALNEGGMLAVQLPNQRDLLVFQLILQVAKKWNLELRPFHHLTNHEYYDLLSDLSDNFEIWQINYMHHMPSYESIIEWYKGTGLRPYLKQLPEDQQEAFIQDLYCLIEENYPKQKNGEILFEFPRLFFTIKK